ncbi:MAG: hypothetical protein ACREFI_16360 [Stellaceae bacterium]
MADAALDSGAESVPTLEVGGHLIDKGAVPWRHTEHFVGVVGDAARAQPRGPSGWIVPSSIIEPRLPALPRSPCSTPSVTPAMNRRADAGALSDAGQNTTTFQLPSKRHASVVTVTSVAGESATGIARVGAPELGTFITEKAGAGNTITTASIAIDAVQNRMGLSPASAVLRRGH